MKKIGICLVLAFLCLSLFSCSGEKDELSYTPYSDPPLKEIGTREYDSSGICKDEKKYDKMVILLDKDVYSISKDEGIFGRLENQNPGHGFYFSTVNYVDKKINGEWVRQAGKPDDFAEESHWMYCIQSTGGSEPDYYNIEVGIEMEAIQPEATPGEYRLVVFTPLRTVYAEFTLTE